MNQEKPGTQKRTDSLKSALRLKSSYDRRDAQLWSVIGSVVAAGMWLNGDAVFAVVVGLLSVTLVVLLLVQSLLVRR